MKKFKVGDLVYSKKHDAYFRIRNVYDDCYDAAECDKDGNLSGFSIDIWIDNIDEDYVCEADLEKIS